MSPKPSGIIPAIAAALEKARLPSEPWYQGVIAKADTVLTIAGVGPIGLPLRPADVRKLASVASQAPYGKRTETIVDTSVRDTLEISADIVEYSSDFAAAIQTAVAETAEHLQLDGERLRAELYKLLIYTKGGFFLPHRDSEKRRGMVATMIVVLPSRFSGGKLFIRHEGRSKAISFDSARLKKIAQYVSFFADCEHEVKKVTSGVRVCLAFNLMLKPERKTVGRLPVSKADPKLLRAVKAWMHQRNSDPLVFALEHQYTAAGLKPDLLKGADRELYRQVAVVCQSTDCRMYLGQVSRHLCQHADDGSYGYGRRAHHRWSGDYDDLEIGEAFEDEVEVDGWKDADGKTVRLASLRCDTSQLISATPVEKWVPTKQDYEGYTGNAGNTLDRWYHKSAVVIWPSQAHFKIIAQMSLEFAIEQFLDMRRQLPKLDLGDELEQAWDDCEQLAEAIIHYWPNRIYEQAGVNRGSYPYLQKFVSELPQFDDPNLLAIFLRTVAQRDWQIKLDDVVLNSLQRMDVTEVLPLLQHLIEFEPPPNQYGIRFLEGLAERDAAWLLKLARDRKRGGLNRDQLEQLIASATKKLCNHVRRMVSDRNGRSEPPTSTWQTLCKAAIAAESRGLSELLNLSSECEQVFDLRKTLVAAAIDLKRFAKKRSGEFPAALQAWIETLQSKLQQATESEPRALSVFVRPSETGCSCQYCRQLSEFLADPAIERTRIAASGGDRDHLKQIIYSQKLDVETKLIKSGSPYSLECTKTTDSHERQLKQYNADLKLLASLEGM